MNIACTKGYLLPTNLMSTGLSYHSAIKVENKPLN